MRGIYGMTTSFRAPRQYTSRYGEPPMISIMVSGTTTFSGDQNHAFYLAQFKEWLRARHPGTKSTVRCRWRPEEYGRVRVPVKVPPLTVQSGLPLKEQQRLVDIERSMIENAWRDNVGWRD